MQENQKPFFQYDLEEITYLKKRDKKLGEAIDKIGLLKRPIDKDVSTAIIRAIIGQQISRQARETVFGRMEEKLGKVTAISLNPLGIEEIQAFGTTFRKAEYLMDFSNKVCSGEIDLSRLHQLSDKEVIDYLCGLKGIGVWTAEMLLASALQRKDVFSFGDLAIHRGLRMLYRHKTISKSMFERYRNRYSPYGTVASIYLWAIAAGAIDNLVDPENSKVVKRKKEVKIDFF